MMAERRDDGFTLMEAIVSLAIFALVLIATQRGFATGSRALRDSQQENHAAKLAQSLLTSVGRDAPLNDGVQSEGQDRGYSWSTKVSSYTRTDLEPDDARRVRLFWVEADVRWRTTPLAPQKSVLLKTLKAVEVRR